MHEVFGAAQSAEWVHMGVKDVGLEVFMYIHLCSCMYMRVCMYTHAYIVGRACGA